MPEYEENTKLQVWLEKEGPDRNLFIGLGWDKDQNEKKKHYRRLYP